MRYRCALFFPGIPVVKSLAWWFRIPFWQRVMGAFVFGALVGWLMGESAGPWLQPLGDLYITLIRMIAVPLVFFAVIDAVGRLHGQKSIAALGGKTFLWFALTAICAVAIGLGVAWLMEPGKGVTGLVLPADYVPRQVPGPVQVLLGVVPSNPFAALA